MHQSSIENMQICYEKFVKRKTWSDTAVIDVVDIGGSNVNGSYADIFSGEEFRYRAVDIEKDESVDVVLEDPYKLPFNNQSIDIVISGQAFEHVEFFWVLFAEMKRILKNDGLIILIAPSGGPIHRFPVDCYRFYPDAYRALAKYCECELIYLKHDQRGPWKDLVGVFSIADSNLTFKSTKNWQRNRYELQSHPAPTGIKHPDMEVEKLQGEVSYLELLENAQQLLNPNLYLEIGVRTGKSLCLAQCQAIGIDPDPDIKVQLSRNHRIMKMTSDSFFDSEAEGCLSEASPDLIFIDGMHLFEFVLRDFINSEKFSNRNTVLIIDDVLPNHQIQALRYRQSSAWTGDVWKIVECLSEYRPELTLELINTFPTGLLIVTGLDANNSVLTEQYNPIVRKYKDMTLDGKIKEKILNREEAIAPKNAFFFRRRGTL
jgi:predicted O-methyltransferase YrrM